MKVITGKHNGSAWITFEVNYGNTINKGERIMAKVKEKAGELRGQVKETVKEKLHLYPEFTVQSGDLSLVLDAVKGITPKAKGYHNTFPILQDVLLEAGADALTIRATDLEVCGEFTIPAKVHKGGAFCLPALQLTGIAKGQAGELHFVQKKGKEITVNDSVSLQSIEAEEFPAKPDVLGDKALTFPLKDFQEGVERVAFAISTDAPSRPALSGMLVKQSGMIATDGHRLSRYMTGDPVTGEPELILPPKVLSLLARMLKSKTFTLDPVILHYNDKYCKVAGQGWTITSKLVEGPYPNVDQVIPSDNRLTCKVDSQALMDLVKRASAFSDSYTHQVKLTVNGSLIAEASTPDLGKFKDSIPCETGAISGKPYELIAGFNGAYLREVVKALKAPQVVGRFNTALSASLWTATDSDKHLCLLMPIRLPE